MMCQSGIMEYDSSHEQVIAVPKILQDRIPQRFVDQRQSKIGEQLVEVSTVLSPSFLHQQSAEQMVDNPSSAWSWGCRRWRSVRFSPRTEFNSAGFYADVDIPVRSGALCRWGR